jgi:hypothetical protein
MCGVGAHPSHSEPRRGLSEQRLVALVLFQRHAVSLRDRIGERHELSSMRVLALDLALDLSR